MIRSAVTMHVVTSLPLWSARGRQLQHSFRTRQWLVCRNPLYFDSWASTCYLSCTMLSVSQRFPEANCNSACRQWWQVERFGKFSILKGKTEKANKNRWLFASAGNQAILNPISRKWWTTWLFKQCGKCNQSFQTLSIGRNLFTAKI